MITDLPIAFTGLCLLLGILYAAGLYFREKRHEIPEWLRWTLAVSRGISVFLLAFLLLSPLYKTLVRNTEPPLLIIAQDNSGSLVFQKDSTHMTEEYPYQLQELKSDLEDRFMVHSYLFGNDIRKLSPGEEYTDQLDFTDKRTRMAPILREFREVYENRNVGAVILGSDGIYNTGMNPLYAIAQSEYPYYVIALGDTSIQKDLVISNVRYNRISYLNNKFPIEVSVTANRMDGAASRIVVRDNNSEVSSESFRVDGDSWVGTFRFVLESSQTGLQRYRISVAPTDGELSTSNNFKSIYIEVLDTRNRILILANSPHPDISAMKEAIRSNMNYEVEDFMIRDFNEELDPYSLVVLHQLPSSRNSADNILKDLKQKGIPYLVIAGGQTNIPGLNSLGTGIQMQSTGGDFQETLPVLDKNFSLFTVSDKLIQTIPQLPPLTVPFGTYQVGNGVESFMNQRIGSLTTRNPLVFFSRDLDRKWGVIMGTGIWRWRIMSYGLNGDHTAFNELLVKMIQFLSLKDDRSRFRVFSEKNFFENQAVSFEVEIYNESYELITEPEAELTIKDEEGNSFPFALLKKENNYSLNAGNFPPGKYTFTASAKVGDSVLYAGGAFTVSELNIEMINTTADHSLLANIAERTGGKLIRPDQLEELKDELLAREDLKPLIYVQNKFVPLIEIPWILLLIFILLVIEWFARRRQGAY